MADARTLVKAMLEVTSKGKGIDRETLMHVKSCTSSNTRISHGHAPFCDLVTELPGYATVISSLTQLTLHPLPITSLGKGLHK